MKTLNSCCKITEATLNRIFEEGYQASARGDKRNPYSDDEIASKWWQRGFMCEALTYRKIERFGQEHRKIY